MNNKTKPIIESDKFIVLNKYVKDFDMPLHYQTEDDLERELIKDLVNQGYEYRKDIRSVDAMRDNVRACLESLNKTKFSDDEWLRFCRNFLDNASDSIVEKTRKVHEDYIHDFTFDDGRIQNIYLFDKKNLSRNKVEVINQFEQTGTHANRYDVTILVNGLPLVQVELKKRGVAIREAFNQVHRYSKESFNSENSLYKYLQLFVISNGTDTRYFANTTKRNKNSFDFTINWAKSDNKLIKDLKDFTATFLGKETLLSVVLKYSVFDVNDTLLVMRPYQIAATERILWKVKSSFEAKNWSKVESGGYVWHTTGSGKTLTSFKAARLLATEPEFDFIDKVLFVVDRKDLDFQTMKEYQKFSENSVNGSNNTAGLKANLEKDDNKIVVTTIQKLNNLMKTEKNLDVYNKHVVFIFDEAHRSQFGEAQKNLKKKFKNFYQFGFTGTPIFPENALGAETTASVFGTQLHTYVITDAIRDEKVLKFNVKYNDVRPKFKAIESEQDMDKLTAAETRELLLHPQRINEVTQYILDNFNKKTHRRQVGAKGFNAMFAVSSVEAAKHYYEEFKNLQKNSEKPLKIATIFSFAANEAQDAIGDIQDETFEPTALNSSAKEFLTSAINDYNKTFKTSFSVESKQFQNYYRDLSNRVKNQEVDLIIVVGMFLTGFDAPSLNTLFVDKNLRYHGLIQAYSRTNRIYDATKTFGNVVTFRNLEKATIDAIRLFGDENTNNVVLEKSFKEYMEGFTDIITGKDKRGFIEIVEDLNVSFPNPQEIETEKDKKAFVKLFGEYLKVENILQNYDEFVSLKALQGVDLEDEKALEEFKNKYHLDDNNIEDMKNIFVPSERALQDYKSTYNDICDWQRQQREGNEKEDSSINWDDVVFEVELLKSQEINLDYILELIFEKNKDSKNKDTLVEEVRRLIRSSIGNRSKEGLLVDFINETNLDDITDKESVIDAFYEFARDKQKKEVKHLIDDEELNIDAAKRYIMSSLRREYASENGTELNEILPKMSPLNPQYLTKKQTVFEKISMLVDKFKGVGGEV
jgi:type I restriction enzyme R subunit